MTQPPPGTVAAAEAAGIRKQFGSTRALRGVDLTLRPGRCLGLVGRNGAGKSTLVSILSGITPADAGEVRFDGRPAPPLGSPGAWRSRIATVFQHSMVVPGLTVAENVFLGNLPRRAGRVDWRELREQAAQAMAEWGFSVDVDRPCSALTVDQRQIVEIVRALAAGTRCLLLDEPTAALERGGIEHLFQRVRQLTASGVAVLYISHHLEEVFEICQDVAVLRDGELVLTGSAAGLTRDRLVTAMVGAEPATARLTPDRPPAARGRRGAGRGGQGQEAAAAGPANGAPPTAPCLTVEHVSAQAAGGPVSDVSLTVGPGERVGLTGLLSAGVTTLAQIVAGAAAQDSGQVLVAGQPLAPGRRDQALRAGVGYIPGDRQADGFVPLLSVAENSTMTITDWLARGPGLLRPRARTAAAAPLARALSVVSAGLGQPVAELSGGNQQKVTVSRALAREPRLIVAITPTRGVDVAARSMLLAELARVTAETGAGLLLASDELDDLDICDRVLVMLRGRLFTEFRTPPFDREALIAATEGLAAADGTAGPAAGPRGGGEGPS